VSPHRGVRLKLLVDQLRQLHQLFTTDRTAECITEAVVNPVKRRYRALNAVSESGVARCCWRPAAFCAAGCRRGLCRAQIQRDALTGRIVEHELRRIAVASGQQTAAYQFITL
jgi:hypothetical protein